MSLPQEVTI